MTSDAGLLAVRELDDALGLIEIAGRELSNMRTGRNVRHTNVMKIRAAKGGEKSCSTIPKTGQPAAGRKYASDFSGEGGGIGKDWVKIGREGCMISVSGRQTGKCRTK